MTTECATVHNGHPLYYASSTLPPPYRSNLSTPGGPASRPASSASVATVQHRHHRSCSNNSLSSRSNIMTNSMDNSLLWQRDVKTLKDIVSADFANDERSFLVKVQCTKEPCHCALSNQDVLMLKPVNDVSLVTGVWNKQRVFAPGVKSASSPTNDKGNVRIVLSHLSTSWFEVLNEGGQSIPHWTSVKDIIRYRPQAFLLRKDMRCLFARSRQGNGSFELSAESTGVLRSGTVLNFLEANRYRVLKGRKIKEVPLVKCSDNGGHLVFLAVDEKCALSPVAGPSSISGVHTVPNLISGFHFPLSVRPVCGAPQGWLNASDRYHLRLTGSGSGDLLFMAALNNPEKFYVVTPHMMHDHLFRVAETEQRHHLQMLDRHSLRVVQFLQAYHPHDALRYLLRNMSSEQTSTPPSNESGDLATSQKSSSGTLTRRHQRNHSGGGADSSGGSSGFGSSSSPEEERLMDEVEDIYYYVRTGRFPTHSSRAGVSGSNGTALAIINARTKQVEMIQPVDRSEMHRSNSCDDLLCENRPPPLPPRLYGKSAKIDQQQQQQQLLQQQQLQLQLPHQHQLVLVSQRHQQPHHRSTDNLHVLQRVSSANCAVHDKRISTPCNFQTFSMSHPPDGALVYL